MEKYVSASRAVATTSAARSARSAARFEPWRPINHGFRHGIERQAVEEIRLSLPSGSHNLCREIGAQRGAVRAVAADQPRVPPRH